MSINADTVAINRRIVAINRRIVATNGGRVQDLEVEGGEGAVEEEHVRDARGPLIPNRRGPLWYHKSPRSVPDTVQNVPRSDRSVPDNVRCTMAYRYCVARRCVCGGWAGARAGTGRARSEQHMCA